MSKVRFEPQPNRLAQADFFFLPSLATAEDLDRIISVNLRGTFLCYKYAGLQMIAQGRGGRIIGKAARPPCPFCVTHDGLDCSRTGACSGTGKQGQASLSAYSASKFGIRALTQCAGACLFPGSGPVRVLKTFSAQNSALEFGRHRITVNAYAPGPVKTPMCKLRPFRLNTRF